MGAIKPNNYLANELEMSHLFAAFSHPARKRMIQLLAHHYVLRNIDLSNFLNLSPTSIKIHLEKLDRAGLIRIQYETHWYEISLVRSKLAEMMMYLETLHEDCLVE